LASNGSGRGGGKEELRTFVVYDIPEDKLRNRIADVCQDYGLERIQYSAFVGKLGSNRREELYLKLQKLVGQKPGKVMVMALCEKDVKGIREILNVEEGGKAAETRERGKAD